MIIALRWTAKMPVAVAETGRMNAKRHHLVAFLHGYTNRVCTQFDPGEVRTTEHMDKGRVGTGVLTTALNTRGKPCRLHGV